MKRRAHNRLGFSHRPTTGSYRAIHTWINAHHPRVGRCEWCAQTRRTLYAVARPGHYTRNRADWLELCWSCHRHFDGFSEADRAAKAEANRRRRGEKRSPQGAANIAAANRRRSKAALGLAVAFALLVAGCGGSHHKPPYKTQPRPALPASLAAPAQSCKHVMGGCLPHPKQGVKLRQALPPGAITGPDFSNNDPVSSNADWQAIAAHNRFAYLKSWEGNSFFDSTAAPMTAQAKAHHVPVGGYDFQHVCTVDAAHEASSFVAALRRQGLLGAGTLPPAGDVEFGNGACGGRSWEQRWVDTVYAQDGHVCPDLYSGGWFWNPTIGNFAPTCAGKRVLFWVSGYPNVVGWLFGVDIHQYSDHGFNGATFSDMSVWLGSPAAFAAFANTQPPPPPDPFRFMDKTVRQFPGGARASEYNTAKTWAAHHCLNPVKRPVCKNSRAHLQLLVDRLWFVAHHPLRGGHPTWGLYHRRARFLVMWRDLHQTH